MTRTITIIMICLMACGQPAWGVVEGEWEITPESEKAVERGLQWLAQNQGPVGNWGSQDLGLVALGAMAFLSACLLYTSPSPRDQRGSRMPSSA